MNANRRLKSIVRSACAIPLLPPALMERGIQTLIQEAAQHGILPHLDSFFQYLINTWMAPNVKKRLSVFRLRHRTNNVAESNNRLRRGRTGAYRPGLWHFLCK